jgi:hypothetical protein
MADQNLTYARELLLRINNLTISGKSLADYFAYDTYSLWQCYQEAIFADLKVFSSTHEVPQKKSKKASLWRQWGSGCLIFMFSLPGILSLFLRKPTIMFYTIDRADGAFLGDMRIGEVFRFLLEKKISFKEIIHSSNGATQRTNFFKRGRTPLYYEALDFIYKLFSLVGATKKSSLSFLEKIDYTSFKDDKERAFVVFLLKKYAILRDVSVFKITWSSKLLTFVKPKALFLIDDGRQYYFELLAAARNASVPSYAFQHGHITKYQVGWQKLPLWQGPYLYPDHYMLWSEYWINELLRFNTYIPKERMVIGGSKTALLPLAPHTNNEPLSVVIPYETIAPQSELKPYLAALCNAPHISVTFKLRLDMSKEKQCGQYGLVEVPGKVEAVTTLPLKEQEYDVVLGVYSSYLYDMIAFGVPVGLLATSFDYGIGMVDNGLADMVRVEHLFDDITHLAALSDTERERRRTVLFGAIPKQLYQTLEVLGREKYWYV